MTEAHTELERLAKLADKQYPLSTAEDEEVGSYHCPLCDGEGSIEGKSRFTKHAAGLSIFGIGDDMNNLDAYINATNPAAILSLLADIRRLEGEVSQLREHGGRWISTENSRPAFNVKIESKP